MVTLPNVVWALREWLLIQAEREASNGCTRFFAIQGTASRYVRDVTNGWSNEKLLHLMRSRIKRIPWYYLPQPLPLSSDEEAVADVLVWPVNVYSTSGRPQVLVDYPNKPGVPTDADKVGLAKLEMEIRSGKYRVNKSLLRRSLRESLQPILGRPTIIDGECVYFKPMGPVTVQTSIDMSGGALAQLAYSHRLYMGSVKAFETSNCDYSPQVSIACLFDVGAGPVRWECLTDEDVPPTSKLVATLVTEFLESVPLILRLAQSGPPDAGVMGVGR